MLNLLIFIIVLISLTAIAKKRFDKSMYQLQLIEKYNTLKDPNYKDSKDVLKYLFKKKLIEYSIITIFCSFIITYILINLLK